MRSKAFSRTDCATLSSSSRASEGRVLPLANAISISPRRERCSLIHFRSFFTPRGTSRDAEIVSQSDLNACRSSCTCPCSFSHAFSQVDDMLRMDAVFEIVAPSDSNMTARFFILDTRFSILQANHCGPRGHPSACRSLVMLAYSWRYHRYHILTRAPYGSFSGMVRIFSSTSSSPRETRE